LEYSYCHNAPTARSVGYGYDGLGQLKTVDYSNVGTGIDVKFDYDAWGNRTKIENPMEVVNYAYGNGTNELAEYTVNGNLKVKSNYDQNGNVLSESYERLGKEVKKTEYSWNAEGELNQVSHEYVKDPSLPQLPDQSLKFKYDENGNRIKKEVDGKTRYYINEGNTVLNELDENGEVVRTMVRGLEPVAEIEGDGTIRYLHQDALGSTVMETGSNGEVVREYDYDVYGGMLGLAGGTGSGLEQYNAEGTRYLYTDQEFDSESNLYYYNARYYNPSTGRFLSRDPILGQPGNVLSNNPYIYVQNNPLKYVDPSGMIFIDPLSITLGPSILTSNIVKKTAKDVSDKAVSLAIDTYDAAKAQANSPKSSINSSTSKNVGNPSGSKNSFKQQLSITEIAKVTYKTVTTVMEYWKDSNKIALAEENSNMTPWEVGVEWLTGTGPESRTFTDGDYFTELLKQHSHVQESKEIIAEKILSGQISDSIPYSLKGFQGVGKFTKDYTTLLTFGYTGNLAATYLGSYSLEWEVLEVNKDVASVQFTVTNNSTIQSALRPAIIGYTKAWQNTIGSFLNDQFEEGPMSLKSQTITWQELIILK